MYQVQMHTEALTWSPLQFSGVSLRTLFADPESGGTTVLTRMAPGATIPEHMHTKANETVYVLEGDFVENRKSHGPGSFFAGKAGTSHGPHSTVGGCVLLTTFSAELDFVLV